MTKKKLNIGSITNELEGASLFFTKPASPLPAPEPAVPLENNQNNPLADSPFFENTPPPSDKEPVNTLPSDHNFGNLDAQAKNQKRSSGKKNRKQISHNSSTSKENNDKNVSMQASNNASMHANKQSLAHDSIIEVIRKAVKYVGKDSATYRFTPEEKKALLELSFSFKIQGFKTSENELVRIAINFLLEDQKINGRNSVLQSVLDALNK